MTDQPVRILVIAMGGTIAMRQRDGWGSILEDGADELIASTVLPAGVVVEQQDLTLKPSASVTLTDVAALCRTIERSEAEGIAGIVVTHGTDTLEETAFALGLMWRGKIPVVVTGAMRSADRIGADGPANLANAILVASHAQARRYGVLVVFGDEIHAGPLVRKVHSGRPHAFSSEPYGPLGHVTEDVVRFEMASLLELPHLTLGDRIPVVPILQAGLDLEPEAIRLFEAPEIDAIVISGVGGGHVSARAAQALERLARLKPVVMTSRVGMGPTLKNTYAYEGGDIDLGKRGILNGGRWRPTQARILLQLLIRQGKRLERLPV
ncbi:asparaginase [Croceicoccus ponticola]|uniref:Asparaginase n=1 Tax=Croceicoccus ponticola TaxID=2217664 RepID=A0A437GUD8_9SPHN|nr:asparaginase [Croceicoccus ponticola]RVQ64614.1 asparaginase [Croceicoccus ponticola]